MATPTMIAFEYTQDPNGCTMRVSLAAGTRAESRAFEDFIVGLCRDGLTNEVVEAYRAKLKEAETVEEMNKGTGRSRFAGLPRG